MKRTVLRIFAIFLVGILLSGCSFFGESPSDTTIVPKGVLKNAQGLVGPVKQVNFVSPEFFTETLFGVNGIAISQRSEERTKEKWEVIKFKYDYLEREIVKEVENKDQRKRWILLTNYDNAKREFQTRFTDQNGKVTKKYKGGLGKNPLKKKEWVDDFVSLFVKKEISNYEYDESNALRLSENLGNYRSEYHLNDQGRLTLMKRFTWSGKAYEPSQEHHREYEGHGFVSMIQEISYKDGESGKKKYSNFEIDSHGNWIKRTATDHAGKTWMEARIITYYK